MTSLPDATTLRELQAGLAACLEPAAADSADDLLAAFSGQVVDDGPGAQARLGIYRRNARHTFENALQRTYPVVRRRVGDDFFARLAADYGAAHPSRSGDLQYVGVAFPEWLAQRLAGTEYAWLGDLARLEWACEEVLVAPEVASLSLEAIADIPGDRIAGTAIELAPSIRCIESAYPVWSVWQANQPENDGAAVDPALGAQCVVVQRVAGRLALHCVPVVDFTFVSELARGKTLEAALDASGLEVSSLPQVLGWLFASGMVTGLRPAGPR